MANEKRLVDANALWDKINNSTAIRSVKVTALVFVDTAPTVDAMEVVRCKDCKRYSQSGLCNLYLSVSHEMKPDDYCSYGERKDND